jgi:hypothetical protein
VRLSGGPRASDSADSHPGPSERTGGQERWEDKPLTLAMFPMKNYWGLIWLEVKGPWRTDFLFSPGHGSPGSTTPGSCSVSCLPQLAHLLLGNAMLLCVLSHTGCVVSAVTCMTPRSHNSILGHLGGHGHRTGPDTALKEAVPSRQVGAQRQREAGV